MTLMTKVDEFLTKEKDIHKRIGSLIADALIGRVQSKGIERGGASTKKDIINAISKFPAESREEILIEALIAMATKSDSSSGVTTKSKSSGRKSSFDW